MTNEELYIAVQDLVNQNSTNNNIALDKPRFIDLYNTFVPKYIKYTLAKANQSDIRNISFLLERKNLQKVDETERYNSYSRPDDYFDFSNIFPVFSSEGCKLDCEVAREVRSDEVDLYYSDKYNEPNFKVAETIYHQSAKGWDIYKKGFEIVKVELLYYKVPTKIDIPGWIHEDGTQSTDIQNDLPENIIFDVALMLAKIFAGSREEMQKYNILSNELNSKK